MNLEVDCPGLLPFNRHHRLALIAAATQVSTLTLRWYKPVCISVTPLLNRTELHLLAMNLELECSGLLPFDCHYYLALIAAATHVSILSMQSNYIHT